MCHHRGKRNQSFDAAETLRERAELDVIEEAARGIERAQVEGEHAARTFLLASSDFMMWMRGQAGVEDLADFGMRVEMARHGDAVGVVLQHANGERLDAARNEEAIHRRKSGSSRALKEINLLGVLG